MPVTYVTYACQGCGIEVVRQVGDEGRARFCSVKCGRAHQVMATREERYWMKVIRSDEGCWDWAGSKSTNFGYGLMKTGPRGATRQEAAHRLSWEIHFGPIPAGMNVCHRCDNPPCSRPDHLFLGDDSANMRDRDIKGRHGSARLTSRDVRSIRARAAIGERQASIARDFTMTPSQISQIVHRKAWKHVA